MVINHNALPLNRHPCSAHWIVLTYVQEHMLFQGRGNSGTFRSVLLQTLKTAMSIYQTEYAINGNIMTRMWCVCLVSTFQEGFPLSGTHKVTVMEQLQQGSSNTSSRQFITILRFGELMDIIYVNLLLFSCFMFRMDPHGYFFFLKNCTFSTIHIIQSHEIGTW